ncbi:MAG: hypothetical protein GXP55_05080 [Deltaproteobacteria bacterium]|nr:hypothetical protein [Deltaproteobacteria bacterium]
MKNALTHLSLALLALALAACGQTPSGAQGALTITGRAAPAELGQQFTNVQALRAGTVVAQVPVERDGSFSLRVPAGRGYTLQLTYGAGTSTLVFPRQTGSLERRFDVLGHGSFDLGTVRHIGNPALHSFQFSGAQAALTSTDTAAATTGDTDDVECEDGVNSITGAVCIDDDAADEVGACEREDDGSAEDDGVDGVDCEDGIDSATGAECDGGPAANATDGADGDAEGTDSEDGTPTDATVADHNLPSAAGCGTDPDEDNVDCEDGIDPATGAECDGGPAANADDGTES